MTDTQRQAPHARQRLTCRSCDHDRGWPDPNCSLGRHEFHPGAGPKCPAFCYRPGSDEHLDTQDSRQ